MQTNEHQLKSLTEVFQMLQYFQISMCMIVLSINNSKLSVVGTTYCRVYLKIRE